MNGPHWIKQWIADLAALNDQFRDDEGKIDFDALGREEYAFRTALITRRFEKSTRAKETFNAAKLAYDARVENGKKGGRPRKDSVEDGARESQGRAGADSVRGTPSHSAPARSSGPMPDDVQQVYDFAAAENLDPVDAYECWNVTVNERDGKTADGKKVNNWKAYVRKWCETRASNREEA